LLLSINTAGGKYQKQQAAKQRRVNSIPHDELPGAERRIAFLNA